MIAVVLELTVSANLLTFLGLPYVTDGGCALLKLHPGTDFLILAFIFLVCRCNWSVIVSQQALTAFLCLMLACLAYSLLLTGTGNLIVFLDTFLPAGLLAFILSYAHSSDLRRLRSLLQVVLAGNALLALVETATHATLIPFYLDNSPYHPHSEDFRPTALFDHPLTGSVMTMLGLALQPRRGWKRPTYLGLMWTALLVFGGRVAAFSAVLMVCGCQAAHTCRLILHRRPKAANQALTVAAAVVGVSLVAVVAVGMGFGTRLIGHLYWDDSAQVRLAQWQLLGQLDSWQLLFGTRRDDLLGLLVPLRLGTGVEVIENFWLLMFVSVGAVGFPLFVGALLALFTWCWRRSLLQGQLLLLGVLLVTSTSNSIGRKSTILVCVVAAIACMPTKLRAGAKQSAFKQKNYEMAVA